MCTSAMAVIRTTSGLNKEPSRDDVDGAIDMRKWLLLISKSMRLRRQHISYYFPDSRRDSSTGLLSADRRISVRELYTMTMATENQVG